MPLLSFALVIAMASVTVHSAGSTTSLQITEDKTVYVLSVPVSRLTMTLPKESLVRRERGYGGATESPRYFHFENGLGFIVSGWFEHESGFHGIEKFWASEIAEWQQRNLPAPMDVKFKKVDGWSAITYQTEIPGFSNSHVRAHYVNAGTWIDVHLSMTSKNQASDDLAFLMAYLKSISVVVRE